MLGMGLTHNSHVFLYRGQRTIRRGTVNLKHLLDAGLFPYGNLGYLFLAALGQQ